MRVLFTTNHIRKQEIVVVISHGEIRQKKKRSKNSCGIIVLDLNVRRISLEYG